MSKFLKFIVNVFLTVAILTAIAILVPPFLGVNTTIVDSAGMDTNLPLGSVTYSVDVPVTKLKPGDEILKENGTSTYAYIIEEGDAATGKYKVVSALDRDSASEITLRNSVSRVSLSIPYIGYVVVAMQTVEGIIIIVLVVLFIIILFVLSELWKSRDDDDDDDDDQAGAVYDEVMELDNGELSINEHMSEAGPAGEDVEPVGEEFAEITGEAAGFYDNQAEGGADPSSDIGPIAAEGGENPNPEPDGVEDSWNPEDFSFDTGLEEGPGRRAAAPMAGENGSIAEQDFFEEGEDGQEPYDGIPGYGAADDMQPIADGDGSEAYGQAPDAQAGSGEKTWEEPANGKKSDTKEVSVKREAGEPDPGSPAGISFPEDEIAVDLDPNQFIAVERLSLEQILEQARKRGGEPEVSRDGLSGIDIVDYSKLIVDEME